MNDERSLEDKLFTSELYQMAQREFLNKGLEGAVDKFLEELGNYINSYNGSYPYNYEKATKRYSAAKGRNSDLAKQ